MRSRTRPLLPSFRGVSFDLFGTLLTADRPEEPAAAIGAELADRGVALPDDWAACYAEPHRSVPTGVERPLSEHVAAALASRGIDVPTGTIDRAVRAAFEVPVTVREGAGAAIEAARRRGPVAVLSNCSVPGLVQRSLDRSSLDPDRFDAVVASVDCGWRKPDDRAFAAVADALDVPLSALLHVGDDPATDAAAAEAGGHSVLLGEVPLPELAHALDPEDDQ